MHDDREITQDGAVSPAPEVGPTPAPTEGRRLASTLMALLLMAATCWVIAVTVSPWLVLPYLLLMATILLPSSRSRHDSGSEAEFETTSSLQAMPGATDADPDAPDAGAATDTNPARAGLGDDEPNPATAPPAPTKGRRGKGRSRKARPTPEIAEATWIEVAPGKFVRGEAPPSPATEAGPHEAVGVPVEVAIITPPLLESRPDEAAVPDPTLDFRPDDPSSEGSSGPEIGAVGDSLLTLMSDGDPSADPRADRVASEPGAADPPVIDPEPFVTSAAVAESWDEPNRTHEATPAADGIVPQAGADLRGFAPDQTVIGPEVGEVADPSRTGTGQADAPPEPLDCWNGTDAEGFDPTETPVDETDFDDAVALSAPVSAILPEPFPVADPIALADALPELDGVPLEFVGWTHALPPLPRRPRAGLGARPIARELPPRRSGRFAGPDRSPPDPRRLTRRGAGRPGQFTRTFPPRAPPRSGHRSRRTLLACQPGIRSTGGRPMFLSNPRREYAP